MKTTSVKMSRQSMSVDPVCGMSVDPDGPLSAAHAGHTYHFCSETCLRRFQKEPEHFVDENGGRRGGRAHGAHDNDRENTVHGRESGRGTRWMSYIPLMIVIGSAMAVAVAKQAGYGGPWSGMAWMHDFMGFFLVVFAMFKFFDLRGFSDGFRMYDLIAKRWLAYAYVYPFIELGLGLGYLAQQRLAVLYVLTVVVMGIGAAGVLGALRKGLDVNCACMGTVLKVPLSTVALTENIGMAAMAAWMWARMM